MRNPEKPHIDISYKDDKVIATYRNDKRSYPIRIARTTNWDRAILRMIHANMRIEGITSLAALDLINAEFRELMDSNDPKRIEKFGLFLVKLKEKPWDKLGVNV